MKLSTLALSLLALTQTPALAYDGIKPTANDPDATAKCRALSDLAQKRGTKTLIIGFEGLMSFSAGSAQGAYEYHRALIQGKNVQPSASGLGGFVTKALMFSAAREFKGQIEFLMFPYDSVGGRESTPETCAHEWMKVRGRRLIIVGHSYGGDAAVQLADALAARNVTVHVGMTLDARAIWFRPSSVIHKSRTTKRWENYWQFGGGLPGTPMADANLNLRLSTTHTGLPSHQTVREAFFRVIRASLVEFPKGDSVNKPAAPAKQDGIKAPASAPAAGQLKVPNVNPAAKAKPVASARPEIR